jgi:hypothetical protein
MPTIGKESPSFADRETLGEERLFFFERGAALIGIARNFGIARQF